MYQATHFHSVKSYYFILVFLHGGKDDGHFSFSQILSESESIQLFAFQRFSILLYFLLITATRFYDFVWLDTRIFGYMLLDDFLSFLRI